MQSHRHERLAGQLLVELSELISQELRDPRVGFATVTEVKVSPDLRHARVFVSVMGTDDDRTGTMAALDSARPFVRRELGRRVRLRSTPDVRFVSDTSLEDAQHLTDLMRKTAAERGEQL